MKWQVFAVILLLSATLELHHTAAAPTGTGERLLRKRREQYSSCSCAELGTPTNGYRIPEEGNCSLGAVVSFGCNPSYQLQGEMVLECSHDPATGKAAWDGDIPQCIGESIAR